MSRSNKSGDDDLSTPLLIRGFLGGFLMGLANLVPGISGGTMLLATGIYDRFISAVSQVTTLRFRIASIVLLAVIVIGAGCAIVAGADVLGTLVHERRWIMFSLFIGLTLGGVPLLVSMIKPFSSGAIIGCFFGIAAMALLAMFDLDGGAVESMEPNWIMLLIAGAAGGDHGPAWRVRELHPSGPRSVPGHPVGHRAMKDGIRGDADLSDPIAILVPVAIGAVIGVVLVSNIMQWFLANARKATLGVLMGFLLGAVLGLWPFHAPLESDILMTEVGLTLENIKELKPRDWPVRQFSPSGLQLLAAMGLIVLGFIISLGITMLGKETGSNQDDDAAELTQS